MTAKPKQPQGRFPASVSETLELREMWAESVIEAFSRVVEVDRAAAISEILCDFMRWCEVNNVDFDQATRTARYRYNVETNRGGNA